MYGSIPNRLSKNQRALSKYSVGSVEPGLAFDFVDNVYRKGEGQTANLSSAITHARAGNATMTDGYGPELVVNGGFDSDVSGWIANSNAVITYNSGEISVERVSSANDVAYQIVATEIGKLYEVNFGGSSPDGLRISNDTNFLSPITTSTPTVSPVTFIATSTTTYVGLRGTTGTPALYDNVSVREMPVIKWAPHNLLTYSEDLSNWSNAWGGGVTLTSNASTAPDGTTTADRISQDDGANDGIFVSFTPTSSTAHRANVFLKTGTVERSAVFIYEVGGGTNSATLNITWTSGVPSTLNSTDATDITYTSVGDGWYLVSFEFTSDSGSHRFVIQPSTDSVNTNYIDVWGFHAYRSDLGGMAANPDQPPSRSSYVPTVESVVYLPRVGHHVFNGDAWVNEGVLAESEARTNLTAESTPNNTWTVVGTTLALDDSVSPDGIQNATKITEDSSLSSHYAYGPLVSFTSGSTYTLSAYFKAGTKNIVQLVGSNNGFGSTLYGNFDLENGVVGSAAVGVVSTIQDVGNGWYRCSITGDATVTGTGTGIIIALIDDLTDARLATYTGSTSNNLYAYGAQTEQASTPSSLIPTSGSSVTRAAETFTIPSANLPWPTPQYIGPELVTNGDFSTDSDWTLSNAVISGGVATVGGAGGNGYISQDAGLVTGKVYEITFDVTSATANSVTFLKSDNFGSSSSPYQSLGLLTVGTHTAVFVASYSAIGFTVGGGDNGIVSFDNISVREINPLSVSIAMEGRMTYADTGVASESVFVSWFEDASNQIVSRLFTDSTNTGGIRFVVAGEGTVDSVSSSGTLFSPDILVPYSIAGRHGSTFINGAVDGVALTANTTPTALPDLSSTDLNLAYDYMGTISEFRVWDRDLGDAGIVEATNPSLEPSLSLTFEGTGTNSFVVNDWAE